MTFNEWHLERRDIPNIATRIDGIPVATLAILSTVVRAATLVAHRSWA
jgi:hypothetical protein